VYTIQSHMLDVKGDTAIRTVRIPFRQRMDLNCDLGTWVRQTCSAPHPSAMQYKYRSPRRNISRPAIAADALKLSLIRFTASIRGIFSP
jgi:hypothetical protein